MIWDTFLFSSELDLLELRLWETEDVVDRWLIAESKTTHSGHRKPLFYLENRDRFARWNRRIEHAVFDLPEGSDCPQNNLLREIHQRTQIGLHLENHGIRDDDVVMLSDVDEIPCEAALKRYKPDMGLMAVETPHSYYWLNTCGGGWGAIRIGTWKQIMAAVGNDFQSLRHVGRDLPLLRADPNVWGSGGWHLSFTGGVEAIQQKMAWYQHTNLATGSLMNPRWLRACAWTGMNLLMALSPTMNGWFKFTPEPLVMPKAIGRFPGLLASGVRFAYPENADSVRDAFVRATDAREVGIWYPAGDCGLQALAVAAARWPQKLQVDCCGLHEEREQFWHNVKALGATNVVEA